MSDDCGNSGMSMDEFVKTYREGATELFYRAFYPDATDSWIREKALKSIACDKALRDFIKISTGSSVDTDDKAFEKFLRNVSSDDAAKVRVIEEKYYLPPARIHRFDECQGKEKTHSSAG